MWSDSGSAFSLVCSLISQVSVTCEANVSFKDKMFALTVFHKVCFPFLSSLCQNTEVCSLISQEMVLHSSDLLSVQISLQAAGGCRQMQR